MGSAAIQASALVPVPFIQQLAGVKGCRLRSRAPLLGPIVVLASYHIGTCLINISVDKIHLWKAVLPFALLLTLSPPCQEVSCFVQLFHRLSLIFPPLGWPRAATLSVKERLVQAALVPAGKGFC